MSHSHDEAAPALDPRTRSLDEVVDEVAGLLRERGERMTSPRRMVLTALAQTHDHLTSEDVITAVGELDPTVHKASIYRTLEALSDLGVVQHVHISHGPTTYHLIAEAGPHPHAQCRSCGTVYDLPADLLDAVSGRLLRQSSFVLDTGHVALSGVCAQCTATGDTGRTPDARGTFGAASSAKVPTATGGRR